MSDKVPIVLIPGFGTGLNSKVLLDRYHNGGFFVYDKEIKDKKAAVFVWTPEVNLNWLQSLRVSSYIEHYWSDREILKAKEILSSLAAFLEKHQPECIVAHSLGTELLWKTLALYPLPTSVKKIVFVQSDLAGNVEDTHSLAKAASEKTLELINVFSPADPNLLLSSVLHRQARAGLLGLNLAGCHNILLPWLGNLNIHSAPLSHSWLKQVVAGEVT